MLLLMLQQWAAAGDKSAITLIVGRLCPSLVYHQIIACWLTCWLTAQPTLKVKTKQSISNRSNGKGEGGKMMAMGIRVAGDEEGERDEAGDGVGDEGGV